MSRLIDLSSDTATKPTQEMRRFMAEAEVGDDKIGEDPTVNKLQEMVAELLEKEAAIFLTSGTMCNEIGIKLNTQMGDEIIMDCTGHPYMYEAAMFAAFSGVSCRLLDGTRGVFTGDQVRAAIRPDNANSPPSTMVSIEQPSGEGTGKIWSLEAIDDVVAAAGACGLRLHMDGARLLNAVVVTGIPAARYARDMDTVWIDLSKNLGCPVGAVLAGTREDMARARRYKLMLGGAMRQAGIIAAAGVYALQHNVERLAEDHANAKLLAQGLAEIPGISINVDDIETNIIHFDVAETGRTAAELNAAITAAGVRMGGSGTRMRAVTHLDISRDDIDAALEIVRQVVVNG